MRCGSFGCYHRMLQLRLPPIQEKAYRMSYAKTNAQREHHWNNRPFTFPCHSSSGRHFHRSAGEWSQNLLGSRAGTIDRAGGGEDFFSTKKGDEYFFPENIRRGRLTKGVQRIFSGTFFPKPDLSTRSLLLKSILKSLAAG